MSESVIEIIKRDIIPSTDRRKFSAPRDVTNHVNELLSASYSAKKIGELMKHCGWYTCGNMRLKKHGKTSRFYHLDGEPNSLAFLMPTDIGRASMEPEPRQDLQSDETLDSISKRYRSAQADKERALANTRKIETQTAGHRETHLKLQYEIERKEYMAVSEVSRGWQEAVNLLRSNLYTLPTMYSSRFASMSDDTKIHEEMTIALDKICQRLADAENDVVSPNQDEIYKTQDRTQDRTTEVETSD